MGYRQNRKQMKNSRSESSNSLTAYGIYEITRKETTLFSTSVSLRQILWTNFLASRPVNVTSSAEIPSYFAHSKLFPESQIYLFLQLATSVQAAFISTRPSTFSGPPSRQVNCSRTHVHSPQFQTALVPLSSLLHFIYSCLHTFISNNQTQSQVAVLFPLLWRVLITISLHFLQENLSLVPRLLHPVH